MLPSRNMNIIRITGRIEGMVMDVIMRKRPAPSISADSYNSFDTAVMAARNMMEFQPTDCHKSDIIRIKINIDDFVRIIWGVPPKAEITAFIGPSMEVNSLIIPAMTIHDKKWGR